MSVDFSDASVELNKRAGILDRIESFYLRILRIAILLIATLLIGYAAWLGATSAIKIMQSPQSVKEKEATVAPGDLVSADIPQKDAIPSSSDESAKVNPVHRQFYTRFVDRYYALFRKSFEPYRQQEDKQLSRDEFDDSFVDTEARLNAVAAGDVDFDKDKADLDNLLSVMTQAAADPETKRRLEQYRGAKKVQVARKVQRSRTEYRRGWDSYSTACENWYESPIGCPARRAVQVPYTDTVTVMEFPAGTRSHTQIFKAYQDRYHSLLVERREAAVAAANAERDSIVAGNIEGRMSVMTALWVLGAFLALMFFFLLIAIERHQRRISAQLNPAD